MRSNERIERGLRNEGISNVRINRFLRTHTKTKPIFLNTVPCSSKEKRDEFPYAMVMTTDDWRGWTTNAPGHWVAIWLTDNVTAEYFDSSGSEPNRCILEYMKGYISIKRSSEPLQSFSAATCGFYCVYFLLMKAFGKNFDNIIEKLKTKGESRDIYIKTFIEEIEKWLYSKSS